MIKRIWLFLYCILAVTAYAQQGTLKGNINTENFPEVSFIWHEYNPDTLSTNQFTVKEDGKEVKNITVIPQKPVADSIPQKNKTILFLWENYYSLRADQNMFTAELLREFITNDVKDTTTTFNIAIFNRKQGDEPLLKTKLENFTSDKSILSDFIANESNLFDKSRYNGNNDKSDLLFAIKEGLNLIKEEPKENVRAIVVITSGIFIEDEKFSIIKRSLDNKIPVYVIYYPASKNEGKITIEQLSKETYGQFVSTTIPYYARTILLQWFNDLNLRHYGQDYKITFTSQLERDGNSYPLVLNCEGTDYKIESYKTSSFSLFVWAKEHLVWFLILLVILLTTITLGVIFGFKFIKNKLEDIKGQKEEEEQQKARQLAEQETLKRKLIETQKTIERQQKTAEQEKQQMQEQEQEKKLARLMRAKNLQPRLIDVNNSEMFNISNVTTTIGRDDDNDIVLSNGTVSKHHAQIVFNGASFEICDLQSANGIIVNRQCVENAELKSGDMIQLGETVLKFYV
jgi:pSer/pThr/pTyr-binding forkhead associated (FHA) protein